MQLSQFSPSGSFPACSQQLVRFAAVLGWAFAIAAGAMTSVAMTSVAGAGEYNAVLSVGDVAPKWQELPGVDGRQHSWEDVRKAKIVVVVFTCNTCPYAVDVEERLLALDKKFADQQVALVAINVNTKEADRLPAMRERAQEKGFGFPYLHDESQQIARDFGATTTPQFFVLDGERRVVYMGSLDDSPDGKNVTERYVEAAIEAALKGDKPAKTETVPVGCRIRFPRKR